MLDDRASNGRDVPFTGRHSLNSPEDLWEDFVRTHRREARIGLSAYQITIGVLVAIGFVVMAFHVAANVGTHRPPPTTVYQTPTTAPTPAGGW